MRRKRKRQQEEDDRDEKEGKKKLNSPDIQRSLLVKAVKKNPPKINTSFFTDTLLDLTVSALNEKWPGNIFRAVTDLVKVNAR